MSIKAGLGKLAVPDDLSDQLRHHGFDVLPIGLPHAFALRWLPPHHADPFARMLVAQAQVEDLTLVTRDAPTFAVTRFRSYKPEPNLRTHPRRSGCTRRPSRRHEHCEPHVSGGHDWLTGMSFPVLAGFCWARPRPPRACSGGASDATEILHTSCHWCG